MSTSAITVDLLEAFAREVAELAAQSGVTPAQFLAVAAAEKVGAIRDPRAYFTARGARAHRDWFEHFMMRENGAPPAPGDELPD